MGFKQFDDPSGDWIDAEGKRVIVVNGNAAYTPEGLNTWWTEFATMEECEKDWGLRYEPIRSE